MPPLPPESVRIVVSYADATYDFSWRPAEPDIHVRVAFDAANGDAGEFVVEVRRPEDVEAIIGVLRRTLALTPGPLPAAS